MGLNLFKFCFLFIYIGCFFENCDTPWHCFVGRDNEGTLVAISLAWLSIYRIYSTNKHIQDTEYKQTSNSANELSIKNRKDWLEYIIHQLLN